MFITALNQAISPEERKYALDLALGTFSSHNDASTHDYEMSLGADKTLCLKLGYVAMKTSDFSEEILLITRCLKTIYGCSSEYRKRSFRSIGATELFPLLVQVWKNCHPDDIINMDEKKVALLREILQIFRIYAKLDIAKPFMINFDHGGWLGRIMDLAKLCLEDSSSTVGSSYIINDIVGLIKDLIFRSERADKEFLISLEGGVVMEIINSFCGRQKVFNSKLSELFTAVIWNLVLEKSICRKMLYPNGEENLVLVEYLFKTLCDVSDVRESTMTTKIKRNSISAIGNILSDPKNYSLLLENDKIKTLPILIRVVQEDPDSIVRRRAMRTIRCLASSHDPQAQQIMKQQSLGTFLAETIAQNINHDDENDRDTQIQAFQTVNVLTDAFQDRDWPRLETAILQRIETTTDIKLIIGACRCLQECLRKSPWRRGPSCFSEMFWRRLETTVLSSGDAHASISTLLLEMSKLEKEENNSMMTQPSCLTSSSTVKTLATLLSATGSELESSRNNALDVLLLLVKDESNKRPLAESEDLLSGLVNLCLLQPEASTKKLAKQLILDLVPEL